MVLTTGEFEPRSSSPSQLADRHRPGVVSSSGMSVVLLCYTCLFFFHFYVKFLVFIGWFDLSIEFKRTHVYTSFLDTSNIGVQRFFLFCFQILIHVNEKFWKYKIQNNNIIKNDTSYCTKYYILYLYWVWKDGSFYLGARILSCWKFCLYCRVSLINSSW